MADKTEIRDAIQSFLESWDRSHWMQEHGEWASEKWNDEREDYDEAKTRLEDAIADLPDAESVRQCSTFLDVDVALQELREAFDVLRDQVAPDESDYIAEGTIDPHSVREGSTDLDVGHHWTGWDCTEGWAAFQHGDALVMQWYRNARGERHERDLWVVVDAKFFAE